MLKRKFIIVTSLIFLLCSSLTAFASEPATGTAEFIERLYSTCLGRTPDDGGLTYWVDAMTSGEKSAAQVVAEFYGSEEYQGSSATDADFVESLYYTMMDRGSDADGLAYWLDILSSGVSRNYLISGFVGSQEFTNICSDYNVEQGSIALTDARDQNINTTRFVQRLYSTCLGRAADAEGLNYWCGYVNSGQMTGAVLAQRFFESPEYIGMNKDNAAFIEDLYNTMMNRGSDAEGLHYWEVQLSYVYPRLYILKQFAGSEEFTLICADYGINRGSIDVSYELSEEMQLAKLINEKRTEAGLPELIVDEYSNAYAMADLTYSHIVKYTNEYEDFNSYLDNYLNGLNLTKEDNRIYAHYGIGSISPNTVVQISAAEAFNQLDSPNLGWKNFWGSGSATYTKIGLAAYVSEYGNTVYWEFVLSYENAIPEPAN